jgi:phage regulator Rha-like protein
MRIVHIHLFIKDKLKTMKEISIFTVSEAEPQRMTSLEIAQLTGKNHYDVLKAIRKMEPAWEKVQGGKFACLQKTYELPNGGTKMMPYYLLTKTETLYIATKFNDEARARLVIRWEELERAHRGQSPCNSVAATPSSQRGQSPCALPAQRILAMADKIIGEGLRMVNAEATDTLTATQVAKTFNMTVGDFNAVVRDMGIQYRRFGRWNISDDLADRGLVSLRTHVSYSLKGEKKVRTYMTWTMAGLRYLNAKLGYPNF